MLQLNLANAYLQGGQPKAAETILNRYTFSHKDDGNGWDLLAQAEAALNNRDQELAARAESYALAGRLDQAISLLSSASAQANWVVSNRRVTMRVSTSCASYRNASSHTRKCNRRLLAGWHHKENS